MIGSAVLVRKLAFNVPRPPLPASPDDTANHEDKYEAGQDDGKSENDGRFRGGLMDVRVIPARGEHRRVEVVGGGSGSRHRHLRGVWG